ncbi:MAG TPA: MBL fold hydrolase [Flavobacteriales bacterium]|nr:MBL fold hydrolase [Flavobacteriales bacterium]
MHVRYKALGAARSVTGSRHYFEIGGFNLLLDCGLFQGFKESRIRNWEAFPVNVNDIHAVVISHAHIDHSGYLPRLVKEGYSGPIFCTKVTERLLRIMLLDSAKLHEEEAEWAFKKGYSRHSKPLPLYTVKDAEMVFPLLNPVEFDDEISLNPRVSVRFLNAGHILGAAITEIVVKGETQEKKIVFSGDLGRQDDPLLFPPSVVKQADILLIESTYGDRGNILPNVEQVFSEIVNRTTDSGGCVLIPAFSVGRTQNILFYLKNMMESKKIPMLPVYIDSPMAISVTDLYKSFWHLQKLDSQEWGTGKSVFDFRQFIYVREQSQSAVINEIQKNAIIISASGMCTGGRILHHLFHRLPNENDTLILVGYQAEGTRGRRLEEGEKSISIFGQSVDVKCNVEMLTGLSAHADYDELMGWIGNLEGSPKMTFVVHGEAKASLHLAEQIKERFAWNTAVPRYLESFELFNGI